MILRSRPESYFDSSVDLLDLATMTTTEFVMDLSSPSQSGLNRGTGDFAIESQGGDLPPSASVTSTVEHTPPTGRQVAPGEPVTSPDQTSQAEKMTDAGSVNAMTPAFIPFTFSADPGTFSRITFWASLNLTAAIILAILAIVNSAAVAVSIIYGGPPQYWALTAIYTGLGSIILFTVSSLLVLALDLARNIRRLRLHADRNAILALESDPGSRSMNGESGRSGRDRI